jgi:hypothetical protein
MDRVQKPSNCECYTCTPSSESFRIYLFLRPSPFFCVNYFDLCEWRVVFIFSTFISRQCAAVTVKRDHYSYDIWFLSWMKNLNALIVLFLCHCINSWLPDFLMALQPLWALATFQFPDLFTIGRTPCTSDQLPKYRTASLSGIRTNGDSVRASEDSSCLRPLGYRDRLLLDYSGSIHDRLTLPVFTYCLESTQPTS